MDGVGKRTLINSNFIQKKDVDTMLIHGLRHTTKDIELNGKKIRMSVWIYSSEERIKKLYPNYIYGSNGVIVIYDISNSKTLNLIPDWHQMIKNQVIDDIPI